MQESGAVPGETEWTQSPLDVVAVPKPALGRHNTNNHRIIPEPGNGLGWKGLGCCHQQDPGGARMIQDPNHLEKYGLRKTLLNPMEAEEPGKYGGLVFSFF